MTRQEKLQQLNIVFSPTSPIKNKDFFQGRINQLEKICDAINESGQHAILYGDRGVGKTSLANIMTSSFTNLYPIKITCNRGDNFKTLWKRAISEITHSVSTEGIGFMPIKREFNIDLLQTLDVASDTFSTDIEKLIKILIGQKFLFIFDEFDNVLDLAMRKSFADLIKSFSDNIDNATVVLVGIADNVEKLIGSHQSLERCLKQVKMPRMSDEESSEIIKNGLDKLGLTINPLVESKIVEFSSGFPHYIHLLCKYGCKNVIKEDRIEFTEKDLEVAIAEGIENTNEQLKSSYRKAIIGLSTTNKWKEVLFACAQTQLDEFNCFSLNDALAEYSKITSKKVKADSINYNLKQLCLTVRGDILEKINTGKNARYRFVNPMIRAFIKLKISNDRVAII